MNRRDWRTVSAEEVLFDSAELVRQLIPTLSLDSAEAFKKSSDYGERLAKECREGLAAVLPFTKSEREFLDLLLEQGIIEPALLTTDASLQRRIQSQPLLEWKASNVRRHKGLL